MVFLFCLQNLKINNHEKFFFIFLKMWQFIKQKAKIKYVVGLLITLLLLDYMGVFTHLFELDYEQSFKYPYEGDITHFVKQLRKGERPDVAPINEYNYRFITDLSQKCQGVSGSIKLVVIVKSAAANFDRRQAIRSSWGFERRFSDVIVKTVFIVGVVQDHDVLISVLNEREYYQDVIQVDFKDSYFNNTIKTVSAMKWAVTFCGKADYYYFSDDDMYVSVKNLLRFVRNPVAYPENFTGKNNKADVYNVHLAKDAILYAGYVFKSSPLRHKPSKWYVSLEEYPYDTWPPYVTAGCYVMSNEALHLMYYSSLYTKHFRFDDIFLGLVASKAGIEPFHSDHFHFYHKLYSIADYRYVIASHGFDNPTILVKVWTEQKTAGNA